MTLSHSGPDGDPEDVLLAGESTCRAGPGTETEHEPATGDALHARRGGGEHSGVAVGDVDDE